MKWITEECHFLLASKAASACSLMEERNEERTMKASKKGFQFGLWRRGWGGEAKAHQRADLEQKCIVAVSNLSLYTISFYLLVMSLVLKDKFWM